MFDRHFHIHFPRRRPHVSQRVLRIVSHSLGVAGIGLVAFAVGFVLFVRSTPFSRADAATVTVYHHPHDTTQVVTPANRASLTTFTVTVAGRGVLLSQLTIPLRGVYSNGDFGGVAVQLDGTQIGQPLYPNENGDVVFTSETGVLSPGKHTLALVLVTAPAGTVFWIDTLPADAFMFSDNGKRVSYQMRAPVRREAAFIQVVSQGAVGAFVRGIENTTGAVEASRIGVYAEAEDALLQSLALESSHDLTGGRFDIFVDGLFVGAAVFKGTHATVIFPSSGLPITVGGVTYLVMVPAEISSLENETITVTVRQMTALGARSGQTMVTERALRIL